MLSSDHFLSKAEGIPDGNGLIPEPRLYFGCIMYKYSLKIFLNSSIMVFTLSDKKSSWLAKVALVGATAMLISPGRGIVRNLN